MSRRGRRRLMAVAMGIGLMGAAPAARADESTFTAPGLREPTGLAVLADGTAVVQDYSSRNLFVFGPQGFVGTVTPQVPDGGQPDGASHFGGLAAGPGRQVFLVALRFGSDTRETYRVDVDTGAAADLGSFTNLVPDLGGTFLTSESQGSATVLRVGADGKVVERIPGPPRAPYGGSGVVGGLSDGRLLYLDDAPDGPAVLTLSRTGALQRRVAFAPLPPFADFIVDVAARPDGGFAYTTRYAGVSVFTPGGARTALYPYVGRGTDSVAYGPDGSVWRTNGGRVIHDTYPPVAEAAGTGCAGSVAALPGTSTFRGTTAADQITGTAGDDLLLGLEGDDCLTGGAGDDRGYGGYDQDLIDAGPGDDRFDGQDGADELHGGDGADDLTGASDPDKLFGDAGDDVLYGGYDDDVLFGGPGADTLFGQGQADEVHGDDGPDVLIGAEDDDALTGDAGADTLYGGYGADSLDGGDDDDVLYGQAGADTLRGGPGNDELHGQGENDTLYGGPGNDVLFGDEGADKLFGGDGDDHLVTGPTDGDRFLAFVEGGAGDDVIDAVNGIGEYSIACGPGYDVVREDPADVNGTNSDCEKVIVVSGTQAARKAHAKAVVTKGVRAPKPKRR